MTVLFPDTGLQAERVPIELLRQAPAARKLEIPGQMNAAAHQLALQGLQARHPGASEADLRRYLADLLLGPELAKLFVAGREFTMADGTIPAKYKVLMTLLSDAIQGHADGVRAIAQQARAMGVSDAEICETLRVVYDCGGTPALIIGLNAFRE
jgi:alkylhydroperoxidase/carboxymuconolactone decarboxylase family protein YurZ